MTWTAFGLWLCLGYLAYYGLNVAFDFLMAKQGRPEAAGPEELFFEEASAPELVTYLEDAPVEDLPALGRDGLAVAPAAALSSGLLSSTGGMSIAELLIRAKDELIEHTRAIPY